MWKIPTSEYWQEKENNNNKTMLCVEQVSIYLRDVFYILFALRCAFALHFMCYLVKDCNVKIWECTANFMPFNQNHNKHLEK